MRIKISPGNMKMGSVPSVSLPPITSCRPDAPCTKDCYAMKAWRMYPGARNAWQSNLDFYNESPFGYFIELQEWLLKAQPARFRYNVGGDLPTAHYLAGVDTLASTSPSTDFLVFTKRFEFVNTYLNRQRFSPNLTVILSAWPGLPMENPHGLPTAWMQDGTDDRIPVDAERCPGKCDTCSACWGRTKDVVFARH